MKKWVFLVMLAASVLSVKAQTAKATDRGLWASIATKQSGDDLTTNGNWKAYYGKVLVSWRMLPGDNRNTSFDLYRKIGSSAEIQLNTAETPITNTCFQDADLSSFSSDVTYRLTYAGRSETLATYTIKSAQLTAGRPYLSIPLKDTKDVCGTDSVVYQANDVSVGDLDGDGEFEIIVKRLQTTRRASTDNSIRDEFGVGASYSLPDVLYAVIWDAYKLDGTFLWRVKGGPDIILGNSSSFAVADFDGDGCAEMIIRTCEGTVFGDGTEIGDTNGDGKIDYRTWGNLGTTHEGYIDHYNSDGPEFISVIDGKTGRELARDNFIARENSASWGDEYWKRACSFRVGQAYLDGIDKLPSLVLGRGVYNRSVLEAWDYRNGQLTKRWRFDSAASGGSDKNKDGQPNSAYAGQGNHSYTVADLDGDGKDEIMYGSMAIDDDGYGLWTTGLGHGDAQHVGKFLPDREGLQMFHCLESGVTMVALHDAKDGSVIWKKEGSEANDCGRCMVADVDPSSPGCEFWWAGSNAYSQTGDTDLGYKPSSCNAAIWFDGTLTRQLINENTINNDRNGGRTFTIYRYDEKFINGTKSNPCWYGDFVGDWREEFIVPDQTRLNDLKIFSTWYPTDHQFPWLMTDHTYLMGVLNENIGYNQPPNLGYYLGPDLVSDDEAWEAFNQINAVDDSDDSEKTYIEPGTYTFTNINAKGVSWGVGHSTMFDNSDDDHPFFSITDGGNTINFRNAQPFTDSNSNSIDWSDVLAASSDATVFITSTSGKSGIGTNKNNTGYLLVKNLKADDQLTINVSSYWGQFYLMGYGQTGVAQIEGVTTDEASPGFSNNTVTKTITSDGHVIIKIVSTSSSSPCTLAGIVISRTGVETMSAPSASVSSYDNHTIAVVPGLSTKQEATVTTYYSTTTDVYNEENKNTDWNEVDEGHTVSFSYPDDHGKTFCFVSVSSSGATSSVFTMTSLSLYKQVTISADLYATYSFDKHLDFTNVSGLSAFVASDVETEGYVTLTKVRKVRGNGWQSAVLLKADAAATYSIPVTDADSEGIVNYGSSKGGNSNNYFMATLWNNSEAGYNGATLASSTNGYTNYILGKDDSHAIGFYKANSNPIASGKAFLHLPDEFVPTDNSRISLVLDGETTSMKDVWSEKTERLYYDLQGRRIKNPTKGFYIVNHKKVLVR